MQLSREQVESFWQSRVAKLDTVRDPCHYMDYWMDRYTWETRTAALEKIGCLKNSDYTVDIGCGLGKYTEFLWGLMESDGVCRGFDRKEFTDLATIDYAVYNQLTFHEGLVPSYDIQLAVQEADVVTLLTVWDFMSIEDRGYLSTWFRSMKKGSNVVMIDIMTNDVPWHQQDLSYKHVDEWAVKNVMMKIAGFEVQQQVPVSCANMQIFHKLGKNAPAFYLSKLWDKLPFTKPQVSCVSWLKT